MSHTKTASSGEPFFCQRNNRLWVGSLIGSAVFVLGLAMWLAAKDGKAGFWHKTSKTSPTVARAPAAPPNTMVANPGGGMSAGGRQVAMSSLPPMTAPAPLAAANIPSAPLLSAAARQPSRSRLQRSFNQVANVIRPTVVNINATRPSSPVVAARARAGGPRFIDPFDGVPDKVVGGVALESVGSGAIIDPRGYVITNDHLINGATNILITRFDDPTPLPAELIATDRRRDLALLKISSPGPFPAAKLANSDEVQAGDWVLAVGNPFGLGHSVTAGIISSRRSSIVIAGVRYKNLLQTDAPINQGSSGGPLVNMDGRIIGINTAIYAPTGVFNGTGFAIPSNQVGAFIARTMTHGGAAATTVPEIAATTTVPSASSISAWLGIRGTNVSGPLAQKLGLSSAQGVFVNAVDAGSPAEAAGINRGDVIVMLAGQPITDTNSLQASMAALVPGITTSVVFVRAGEQITRTMTLQPAVSVPSAQAQGAQ